MRDLPAPPTLMNWHSSPYVGGTQHAFTGPFYSACERLRWSARLTTEPMARRCPDCVALVRRAVAAVLSAIGPDEEPMTERELILAKGGFSTT